MARYDVRVLGTLLDSYENSVLSRGKNKVAVHIAFSFTRKTMPEYFDESSTAYEEIHAVIKELERKGFLSVVWKDGKEDFIIQKVILNAECVEAVYRYVKRVPRFKREEQALRMLKELRQEYDTPAAGAFTDALIHRIAGGKSVKEYAELSDTERLRDIIRAVSAIEKNKKELYIREFSIRYFGDSKRFETLIKAVGKVLRRFGKPPVEETDVYAILAEHGIYHTPNYVQLKGDARIYTEEASSGAWLELSQLKQGIGISGEDLKHVRVECKSTVKRVITVENLTTFYRWSEPDSVLVYLGGYHNSIRRRLLQMLYEQMPEIEYLHFGDIDVGGFEIYEDLCRKTGIPFQAYHMGVEELRKYNAYTKPLTENDKKRLAALMERKRENGRTYLKVLEYMEEYGVKLEQECIFL